MPSLKQTPGKPPDRRYYHRLTRRARMFRVDIDQRAWLNLWHEHFDWEGHGDLGWRHRRRHLSVLLQALARARVELGCASMPSQLFAIVHPRDSASDALYVHTENPHNPDFPYQLSGRPLETLPPLLAGRVDLALYEVLANVQEDGTTYVIRPRA